MCRSDFILLTIYVMVFLSLSGCGSREKAIETLDYPVVIEKIEGIKRAHNPDYPKEGTFHYDLIPELSIGGHNADENSILVRPIAFQLDSLGNIYIMDWREIGIKVFAPNGNFLHTVGKQGQGPGEFDIPAYFKIVGDRIFLLDSRQRKFSLLSLDGDYINGFKIDGFPLDIDVSQDGTLYYSQMLNPEVELSDEMQMVKTSFSLFQTDAAGESRTNLGEFRDIVQLKKITKSASGGISGLTSSSQEAYTTSWLLSPEGNVYMGYNQNYEIEVRDRDWRVFLIFGRDFKQIPHPHYKPDSAHPEFYPAFSDWRKFFDEKNNLWLEQYPIEDVEEHVFDVFSPDGIYIKKIIVPEVLYEVKGDKAFGFVRTEEDYVVFQRYKMIPIEKNNKILE